MWPPDPTPPRKFKNLYFKYTRVKFLFISFPKDYTPTISQSKEKNDTPEKRVRVSYLLTTAKY